MVAKTQQQGWMWIAAEILDWDAASGLGIRMAKKRISGIVIGKEVSMNIEPSQNAACSRGVARVGARECGLK